MSSNENRGPQTLGQLMSSVTGAPVSEPIAAIFAFTPESVVTTGLGVSLPTVDVRSVTDNAAVNIAAEQRSLQTYAYGQLSQNPNRPSDKREHGLPTDRTLTVLSDIHDTDTFEKGNEAIRNISMRRLQPDVSVDENPLQNIVGSFDPSDQARPGSTSLRTYTTPEDPIGAAVYDLLTRKNRYSPSNSSPYLNYSGEGEAAFSKGLWSIQSTVN